MKMLNKERNAQITKAYVDKKKTTEEIASMFGVTRQRIHQILKNQLGVKQLGKIAEENKNNRKAKRREQAPEKQCLLCGEYISKEKVLLYPKRTYCKRKCYIASIKLKKQHKWGKYEGQKFNRWSIIKVVKESIKPYTAIRALCKCDCGTKKEVVLKNILNNKSKSCGCILKEKLQENPSSLQYLYTYNGKTQSLTKWSIELGINRGTLYCRIHQMGWSTEKAFYLPVQKH